MKSNALHLEYFDDYFFVVCYVDGFEHFAVFSSAELSHQLIIILIPANDKKHTFTLTCSSIMSIPGNRFIKHSKPTTLTVMKRSELSAGHCGIL